MLQKEDLAHKAIHKRQQKKMKKMQSITDGDLTQQLFSTMVNESILQFLNFVKKV